jgi:hypothetical protein
VEIAQYSLRCRTVSGEDSWHGASGLAHENRGVRVMLLHGRVSAVEEGPVQVS